MNALLRAPSLATHIRSRRFVGGKRTILLNLFFEFIRFDEDDVSFGVAADRTHIFLIRYSALIELGCGFVCQSFISLSL